MTFKNLSRLALLLAPLAVAGALFLQGPIASYADSCTDAGYEWDSGNCQGDENPCDRYQNWPGCPQPPQPTCADLGLVGNYPQCEITDPGCHYYGTCPPPVCPAGQEGTPPYCYDPQPTCADLGQQGTYPFCYTPQPPSCADTGQQGTYPYCYTPPPPSCADYGQVGAWPECRTPTCQELGTCPPPPQCSDYGQQGSYPFCYTPPPPSCADYGQQGTYPNCYTPQPTCADYGQLGSYPYCYSAPSCVANQGAGCYSSANSCGETNYGTIQCDGSCSAGTPSDASCYSSLSASCYPSPGSATIGSAITWIANVSGGSGSYSYSWSNPQGSPTSGSSETLTATYAAGGQYSPSLWVRDNSTGNSVSTSCTPVTIGNSCPSSSNLTVTATPARVRAGQTSTITYDFQNVPAATSCTLTENGTTIASTASASCSLSSGSITRTVSTQTTYVLTCGASTTQVIVNLVPGFTEF